MLDPHNVNPPAARANAWAHAGIAMLNLAKPWPPSGDTNVYSKDIDDAALAPLTPRERSVLNIAWVTIKKDAW